VVPPIFKALAPKLTRKDRQVVDSLLKLSSFLTGSSLSASESSSGNLAANFLNSAVTRPENREKIVALIPTLREFAPNIRDFGTQLVRKLALKATTRLVLASSEAIFGVSVSTNNPIPQPELVGQREPKIAFN
jgi:hypothetical protein